MNEFENPLAFHSLSCIMSFSNNQGISFAEKKVLRCKLLFPLHGFWNIGKCNRTAKAQKEMKLFFEPKITEDGRFNTIRTNCIRILNFMPSKPLSLCIRKFLPSPVTNLKFLI